MHEFRFVIIAALNINMTILIGNLCKKKNQISIYGPEAVVTIYKTSKIKCKLVSGSFNELFRIKYHFQLAYK